MEKTRDTTIIIAFIILIIFTILTVLYIFKPNEVKDNLKSNINNNNNNNDIYTEHIKQKHQANNTISIDKIYKDISTYTTKIYDKDKNRIYNIKLACEKLDGHIVGAGEEFSFNNTMGSMGQADGFKKAVGFDSNGNKIKMYGGGICQISSTLYNAAMLADFEILERHAHSRRVYYVPKNKDATVYSGGPDFRFKNSLNTSIMICCYTDGYTVTVTLKQEKFV